MPLSSPGKRRILTRHGGIFQPDGSINFMFGKTEVSMFVGFGTVLYPSDCIGDDFLDYVKVTGQEYALVGWGLGSAPMCDYSLHHVKSRPAKVGDKLVTREFIGTLTRGFASPEDLDVAVCVLSGTELSFSDNVRRIRLWAWSTNVIKHKTAIFRQVNLANPNAHHDALEFPDGQTALLTSLKAGQEATVLQLPATAAGSNVPQPLTYVLLPPIGQ